MFGINTVLKNEAVTNQTLSNADSTRLHSQFKQFWQDL